MSKLQPQHSSTPRISLTPDEVAQASDLARQTLVLAPACDSTITSPIANQVAVDFLRDRLDPAIDFCNQLFNPILDAINQLKSTTEQSKLQLIGPLLDLKRRLRAALQAWDDHLREVQRQIDTERAKDVARRSREILEQDTLNKANELVEAGHENEATKLLDEFFGEGNSEPLPVISLPTSRLQGSRADGQSSSTLKRFNLLDVTKLKPEYLLPPAPDTRKIQAVVTRHGKQAEQMVSLDGQGGAIEFYTKGSVSVRKRKPTSTLSQDQIDDLNCAEEHDL